MKYSVLNGGLVGDDQSGYPLFPADATPSEIMGALVAPDGRSPFGASFGERQNKEAYLGMGVIVPSPRPEHQEVYLLPEQLRDILTRWEAGELKEVYVERLRRCAAIQAGYRQANCRWSSFAASLLAEMGDVTPITPAHIPAIRGRGTVPPVVLEVR